VSGVLLSDVVVLVFFLWDVVVFAWGLWVDPRGFVLGWAGVLCIVFFVLTNLAVFVLVAGGGVW